MTKGNPRATGAVPVPGTGLDDLLAQVVGKRIAGGCDDCDAYQEVTDQMPGMPGIEPMVGIWFINICHDDDCPTLARHQRRRP